MRRSIAFVLFASLFVVTLLLGACSPGQSAKSDRLVVVATTTIVADVVKNIGGEHIDLTVLVPANVDEHGYEPTPQDIVKVSRASLLFINGAGLEPFAERMAQNAGGSVRMVAVSEGLALQAGLEDEHADAEESDASLEDDHSEENEAGDPHVWTDPNNVIFWVDQIEAALREADPARSADYQKNASQYRQQLTELDGWIHQQVEQIPMERRKLVTDHTVFTYFASRYGFEQVGAVVPGYSSLASPSAQEMAALYDTIRAVDVPAIFVGNTSNATLSERVARDTGVKLVPVMTGSLTGPDGPAPTYLEYMRYNVNAFVNGLK